MKLEQDLCSSLGEGRTRMRNKTGASVIKLLIVAAICGMLGAIAVGNTLQPDGAGLETRGGFTRNPTEARMRNAWGIRTLTDEVLKLSAQLGVRDIVVYAGPGSNRIPGTDQPLDKPRADYGDYVALRERLESYGLRIAAIEGGFAHLPKYRDVVFGGPKRDELIQELIAEIRDMARAGIPIYGYHWMINSGWRTKPVRIRGGAQSAAFDFELVRNKPFTHGREYTEEELWPNLEYWIRTVTPIAEREGIRLGIHPDDPPVPRIAGIPRLLRNHAAYRRLVEIYPSDANGIEFCQGTLSEMQDDVYEAIRYFGSRNKILYVHFRNVSGRVPKFHEEFVNTGYVDMHRAMKLYQEVGFEGVFIDDHCPNIEGDRKDPGGFGESLSRVFAQGYLQAILESVQKESGDR